MGTLKGQCVGISLI